MIQSGHGSMISCMLTEAAGTEPRFSSPHPVRITLEYADRKAKQHADKIKPVAAQPPNSHLHKWLCQRKLGLVITSSLPTADGAGDGSPRCASKSASAHPDGPMIPLLPLQQVKLPLRSRFFSRSQTSSATPPPPS